LEMAGRSLITRSLVLLVALRLQRCAGCPGWCSSWTCDGSAWCSGGAVPSPCTTCDNKGGDCPSWCESPTWSGCEACAEGTKSDEVVKSAGVPNARAYGPVAESSAGWVVENAKHHAPQVSAGEVTISGDTRVYLVQDHSAISWQDHKYVRFDLHEEPLDLTVDLSNVPCGCLACLYLVAPDDPGMTGSNYCDMAENVRPGYGGGTCVELDLFEANNHAMQTAIHTQLGGSYGSGNCDKNGCFARVGGPQSPSHLQNAWGKYKTIDSSRPFNLKAGVDSHGALRVQLSQGSAHVTSFDTHMAGNPQGHGVPQSAQAATRAIQGKLALVASMWSSPDMSWLDGKGCSQCTLSSASMKIKINSAVSAVASNRTVGSGGTMSDRQTKDAAELARCDESKCTSVGNDCCAPGSQPRTCSGGFTSVDLSGDCFGHVNARYTCCPEDVDTAAVSAADDAARWSDPAGNDGFIVAGRRVLSAEPNATARNVTL